MKQTALEQAIEKIERSAAMCENEDRKQGYLLSVACLRSLLPVDKQQIKDAHYAGALEQYGHSRLRKTPTLAWDENMKSSADVYFNKTYVE